MKNNKKGFTMVELVIVIAVIAILAAVLIPTFSNMVNRAQISNDTMIVKNLNTAIAADEAINGKAANMSDALNAVKEYGYTVEKMTPTSTKSEILWNSKTNRFELRLKQVLTQV